MKLTHFFGIRSRILVFIIGSCISMAAQGATPVLNFYNRLTGVLDAPVFGPDGTTKLTGTTFVAQLYVGRPGATDAELVAVGPKTTFRVGAAAGYVVPVEVLLEGFNDGEVARLQMRAWDNSAGASSYEQAKVKGASASFDLTLQGSGPLPLLGLKSFKIGTDLPTTPEQPPLRFACDCYFGIVFTNEPPLFGFGMQRNNMVALSGDGETLLATQAGYSESSFSFRRFSDYLAYRNSSFTKVASAYTTGFYEYSGKQTYSEIVPSWINVFSSANGELFVGTQDWTNTTRVFFGSPLLNTQQQLSILRAHGLSGNGRYVFGEKRTNVWVRLDTITGQELVLHDGSDSEVEIQMAGVSYDGSTATFRKLELTSISGILWSETEGWSEPSALQQFEPLVLSGDGRVIGGAKSGSAVIWSASGGVETLAGNGGITGLSYNGTVRTGWTGETPLIVLEDGSRLAVTNAIVLGETSGLKFVSVRAISYDGRTIAGTALNGNFQYVTWKAGIALKEEGPKMRVARLGAQIQLSFQAKKGFRYRLLGSDTFVDWQTVGPEVEGNDSAEVVLVQPQPLSRFLRVEVLPLAR